ncbi:MAG: glycosyltransferase family 2 protein [Candidatus Rokubacteria bacterium]|nr:glycosyltransferase family 2 protein [Candidatus Rokubacteria bacterium]
MPDLSVVIITRNEAARIERCLASVAWADELIIVDAGSTDGTAERCRAFTPHVLVRAFDSFDRQKNFALAQASGRWILSVDADEVVTPALGDEIRTVVARDGNGHAGFVVRRTNYLCGRPIRHVWGRDALVRLVQNGRGRFANTVHEKLQVDGPVGDLREPLLHYNSDTLAEYLAKNHRYVDLEAAARHARGERFHPVRAVLAPLRVFLFRYVRLGGFRDGPIGLILAMLLGFFTFVMHVRLWELRQAERSA